ncbi:MafI family immunity protein [uncultured Kushneria sp.]|uniref:MafI family immunity protein n=1 Tax=uncultured Kushneria sp. TaxID=905033 RepID=UPI002626FF9F|nr:MafI family immunity protein [uncultured Kushneria sp.]
MYAERIVKFGEKFWGRLEFTILQGALDYVEYNEESLAFEILCDHICEYDVSITDEEYREAIQLALDMGFDLKEGPFNHLKGLKS